MILKNNDLKELTISLSVILLVILTFSFILFGVTGMRVMLGIIFVSISFYFILNNFGLNEGEKFVFSALLGLTILPSLVYIFGFLMSFRLAIAAAFIVFAGIAVALHLHKRRKIKD